MDEENTVLITGSDGFLGSYLTKLFIEKNFKIYALKKPDGIIKNLSQYTYGKVEFSKKELLKKYQENIQVPTNIENLIILECDLNNQLLLEKIIVDIKPRYIFHFGAQPNVIASWQDPVNTIRTNVIGTINIFEPLKKNHIKSRVIVACSSAEYGTTTKLNRPLKETDPLLAIHPYGISKIAAELLARQYYINFGLESIILRLFNQTGPRKINDACSDFIRRVAQIELGMVEPVIQVGNLNSYRDITGIKDSLQAIWLAARKGKAGETYNVCSGRKIKIREVLNIALSFSKKEIQIKENIPDKLRKSDEDIILGDNTKIKTELGFEITQSIEKILKDMFDYWVGYYKKNKLF
jgi:GDP-mannose 4,6-dehydratase